MTLESRYARQIRLPAIGAEGQRKLLDSTALIVGLGGLGSPVAIYLAASGVGRLILSDFDRVEESNLQRQIIHRYSDIGEAKAASAASTLKQINPEVEVSTFDYELEHDELLEQANQSQVIVDCTDNFPSRFTLNQVSIAAKKPLVSGAAIRWEGQVTSYDPSDPQSPCYQCLYPNTGSESANCAMEGVVSPLVGIIGTMQALEAIHVLLNKGKLPGTLWLFDGMKMDWQKMKLPKNPHCPACRPSTYNPADTDNL